MKSLFFSEDHQLFRQSTRQFLDQSILPHISEWEKNRRIPREAWLKMGEMGLLGMDYESTYGGLGADFFYTVVLLEELAKCESGGFSAAVSVHAYMATAHLARAGSPFLKEHYLRPAISGKKIGALAISEPGAGSDVAAIRTRAELEGDHFIINGSKTFITNGVFSDFIVVACKTDPQAGASGISLILVDRDMPGVSARPLEKIGWHCSDTAELFFENVRVPAGHLIGEANQGFFYIMDSFQLERLVAGILANGGSEWALDTSLKYLNERETFGRVLKKYQVLRHRFVQLATELEAAKQLTYHACWKHAEGQYAVKEASMVKLYAAELANKIASECLQFFGGYGYIEDFPVARLYRDARVGTIAGGTSEIMAEILAKILIDEVQYEKGYAEGDAQPTASPQTAQEIITSIPNRFRPEKANGTELIVHLDISGSRGGKWTVRVADGKCDLEEGLLGQPNCRLRAKDQVYEDLEWGRLSPQKALFTGQIKISNLNAMTAFTRLFTRLKD